jgi:hypothetical protein
MVRYDCKTDGFVAENPCDNQELMFFCKVILAQQQHMNRLEKLTKMDFNPGYAIAAMADRFAKMMQDLDELRKNKGNIKHSILTQIIILMSNKCHRIKMQNNPNLNLNSNF